MYILINNEYVAIEIASVLLNIDKQELINAGHAVEANQTSFINYSHQ